MAHTTHPLLLIALAFTLTLRSIDAVVTDSAIDTAFQNKQLELHLFKAEGKKMCAAAISGAGVGGHTYPGGLEELSRTVFISPCDSQSQGYRKSFGYISSVVKDVVIIKDIAASKLNAKTNPEYSGVCQANEWPNVDNCNVYVMEIGAQGTCTQQYLPGDNGYTYGIYDKYSGEVKGPGFDYVMTATGGHMGNCPTYDMSDKPTKSGFYAGTANYFATRGQFSGIGTNNFLVNGKAYNTCVAPRDANGGCSDITYKSGDFKFSLYGRGFAGQGVDKLTASDLTTKGFTTVAFRQELVWHKVPSNKSPRIRIFNKNDVECTTIEDNDGIPCVDVKRMEIWVEGAEIDKQTWTFPQKYNTGSKASFEDKTNDLKIPVGAKWESKDSPLSADIDIQSFGGNSVTKDMKIHVTMMPQANVHGIYVDYIIPIGDVAAVNAGEWGPYFVYDPTVESGNADTSASTGANTISTFSKALAIVTALLSLLI